MSININNMFSKIRCDYLSQNKIEENCDEIINDLNLSISLNINKQKYNNFKNSGFHYTNIMKCKNIDLLIKNKNIKSITQYNDDLHYPYNAGYYWILDDKQNLIIRYTD